MSFKYVCDMCKVETTVIKGEAPQPSLAKYHKIFFAKDKTAFVREDKIYGDDYDLCGDCVTRVKKFIENGGKE